MFATGAARKPAKALTSAADDRLKGFAEALDSLCLDLALQVARMEKVRRN